MKQLKIYFIAAFLLLALTSFSQKINKGNVLGISEIEVKLNDDMTFEQFERFYLEEYIPAIAKNFPGVKGILLKGERGERTGKYTEVVIFKSLEERNRWFPEKGKTSEEAKQAFKNMQELQDKMKKMISVTYNDYVAL